MDTDPHHLRSKMRRFTTAARRIARAANARHIMPDFTILAAGLEAALLPAFVASYRSGTMQANRHREKSFTEKAVWEKPGDTFIRDEPIPPPHHDRRAAWLWFAAGAGLVAIAVKNTVVRVIDWLNRAWRKSVGLPKTEPLGTNESIAPGVLLPMPAKPSPWQRVPTIPARIEVPMRLPALPAIEEELPLPPAVEEPKPPEIDLPVDVPASIIEDELHDLKQKAVIEWCKQQGATGVEWEIEDAEACRKICFPLDGKRLSIEQMEKGVPFTIVDGRPIYAPRAHIRCRCRLIPWWGKPAEGSGRPGDKPRIFGSEP